MHRVNEVGCVKRVELPLGTSRTSNSNGAAGDTDEPCDFADDNSQQSEQGSQGFRIGGLHVVAALEFSGAAGSGSGLVSASGGGGRKASKSSDDKIVEQHGEDRR